MRTVARGEIKMGILWKSPNFKKRKFFEASLIKTLIKALCDDRKLLNQARQKSIQNITFIDFRVLIISKYLVLKVYLLVLFSIVGIIEHLMAYCFKCNFYKLSIKQFQSQFSKKYTLKDTLKRYFKKILQKILYNNNRWLLFNLFKFVLII